MRRGWIGLALLSASWLFGSSYYRGADWLAWSGLIAAGALFLMPREPAKPDRILGAASAVLLLPALVLLPWPHRAAALLLLTGLLLTVLPFPRPWPGRLGSALLAAGLVLFAQSLTILLYEQLTAFSHEAPPLVGRTVDWIARLLGATSAYTGKEVGLFTMRKVHLLGATWELVADPATVCFLAGGLMLAAVSRAPARHAGILALLVLLWLPIRAGLMMSLLLHRALLTEFEQPLKLMNQFWNPWLLAGLLAVPAALAGRFLPLPFGPGSPSPAQPRRAGPAVGVALLAVSVALVTGGIFWEPAGEAKGGRVLVDEFHSSWEPTARPFDTTWYGHDAGYNYACIYDYCTRFYDMSRLTSKIDDGVLRRCDVLILKVPTSAYAEEEVDAVVRFVERGGGVLLIGEHTDVFKTSSHLNQVARQFGFEYRKDCLFGIDSEFEQRYRPPLVPHPIVRHLPPLDFAVSCSLAPRPLSGRAAILSTGLWSLPADYRASNFYPQVEDRADMRYGAFVQLWTARRGEGRVVSFTDSTIFSNFCAFEPGKSEIMLGMIDWLNRADRSPGLKPWFIPAGLALGVLAWVLMRRRLPLFLVVAAGLYGWSTAVVVVERQHEQTFPAPKAVRPLTRVVIDRTVSDAPLSKCGFIQPSQDGFGIFDQWILRLAYFTSRKSGPAAFSGDLLVFFQPNQWVTDGFRARLTKYVAAGGKVLVIDSALNKKSTANGLLYPFGLSLDPGTSEQGPLECTEKWPSVPVQNAVKVQGGEPFARANGQPVGASVRHGKGLVVAVGFGARFNDDSMGVTTDLEPGPELRQVFDLEYALLRWIVANPSSAASP